MGILEPEVTRKKCAERVKRWEPDKSYPGGSPASLHDKPSLLFDTYVLVGILASVIAVIFQVKFLSWVACYFSALNLANYRGPDDIRQILSSVLVSITAIVVLYNKDSEPMA